MDWSRIAIAAGVDDLPATKAKPPHRFEVVVSDAVCHARFNLDAVGPGPVRSLPENRS